ncbi:L-rhamnono-gamma-lactonase [Saitoella coloradoensis]
MPNIDEPNSSLTPLLDGHVHLYPQSHVDAGVFAWQNDESAKINVQHSFTEYAMDASTRTPEYKSEPEAKYDHRGFIFVEVGRQNGEQRGYDQGVSEFAYLCEALRNAESGIAGEGYEPSSAKMLRGIMALAPAPVGSSAMEEHLQKLASVPHFNPTFLKGFRYNLQDEPTGTALTQGFIDSMKFLGTKGLRFEINVNTHGAGIWQLQEAREMIIRAHDGVEDAKKTTFIIDHMAKPDLTIWPPEEIETHSHFLAWQGEVMRLAENPYVYIKLSALLTETSAEVHTKGGREGVMKCVEPWVRAAITLLGVRRVVFGSDWPVVKLAPEEMRGWMKEGETEWSAWVKLVHEVLRNIGLSKEDIECVFYRNGMDFYGLS